MERLIRLAELIKDENLRKKVIEFLKNPKATHPEIVDTGISVEESPASINWHHRYEGGLIEHTISVTKMALKIADVLEEVYGVNVNRDYIIAGALLHDIMKPYNYIKKEDGIYDHYDMFNLDHLTLAVAELYKRDFPLEVIKIVASHHGEHSPTRPSSIEAYIVHYADEVDSKINDVAVRVCQARSRDLGISENEIYKAINPLKVYEVRSKEGKLKCIEYLKNILKSLEIIIESENDKEENIKKID
ncbi:Dihydroneopterin 2',3'-cyclic phosphate phosphodiesterase [Methanocaldococcus lauensis]|uniref:Dihydroneopterin 2',3'-cyclic phosphate phosphodiesterase n=1 Tax=Methanocaldococcus lauensis TaxID=2546128 RepID=A0A8D6PS38_9EURY|nr:HDIG domain-containing metalloprotein [Methanocaldococcus lauensis]CAB3287678.1 Dihydroneopterin 2',3'-cyclic phosphate phosphodiesterase [Methanocaldococcus lauensis]